MKRLILFTHSFPFGKGENWIYDELQVLSKSFSISIVPFTYGNNRENRWDLPEDILVEKPLFEDSSFIGSVTFSSLLLVFRRNLFPRFMEALNKKIFLKKRRLHQYLYHIKLEESLRNHPYMDSLIRSNKEAGFYFYWGLGSSQIIPALPSTDRKVFVRMHGYDLYDYRNYGYIPFRKRVMQKASLLLPVSENGRNYLVERYPFSKEKVIVSRLGTLSTGLSRPGTGERLTIFSCSALIALKRVHLIAEALLQIKDIEIKWIHLGDGVEKERIEKIIMDVPANITVEMRGHLASSEIPEQYSNNEADLFLHVSETEGVPVAIMEALAAGIPVMATDVGGTSEIVDQEVGRLLSPSITAEELAAQIRNYYQLPAETKQILRRQAWERYNLRCNATNNAHFLADQFSLVLNNNKPA